MLAPDDISPVIVSIKDFYKNILIADNFSTIGKSLTIYPVKNEASWIAMLRHRITKLCADSVKWQQNKQSIIPMTLSTFINYKNNFGPIAKALANINDYDNAVNVLDRLIVEIEKNISSATEAQQTYNEWINKVMLNLDPIDECIKSGWRDLSSGEHKIMQLTEQIVTTQHSINDLQGVVSIDSISSNTVSDVSSIYKSLVSMDYSATYLGAVIPYINLGIVIYTVGKVFYDIFSTSGKVHEQIVKLSNLKTDLTFEQQALAQTKSALVHIYDVKELIIKQRNTLSAIVDFWKNEIRNVRTVKNSFTSSSLNIKDHPEILQLPIAKSVWNSLRDISMDVVKGLNTNVDNRVVIKIKT